MLIFKNHGSQAGATLGIPVITTLRDSQNYLRAAEHGHGIHEMKAYLVREDIESWEPLIGWLESRAAAGGEAAGAAPLEAAV